MNGQIGFDIFMNLSEEKSEILVVKPRPAMADPCYYCLCKSCINNVENIRTTPDEITQNWVPCYCCDDCSRYDDRKKISQETEHCNQYAIDNYHAEKNRRKFKIMRRNKDGM